VAASSVGLHSVAELYFGIGVVGLVFLNPVVLNRMFFQARLAPALIPTMAMELAPPAIAGNAYFLIHPGPPDLLSFGLAGYAAVMAVAQLRLLPLYRALSFTPGFWSFTFPTATMATFALRWLALERPAGETVYAGILIAAITGLTCAVAARTILAARRGQLLPSPGGAATVAPRGYVPPERPAPS
jgi:tellurite resistance protein